MAKKQRIPINQNDEIIITINHDQDTCECSPNCTHSGKCARGHGGACLHNEGVLSHKGDISDVVPFPFRTDQASAYPLSIQDAQQQELTMDKDAYTVPTDEEVAITVRRPSQTTIQEPPRLVSSDKSESTLSIITLSALPPKASLRVPQASACELEVKVLEKHGRGCEKRRLLESGLTENGKRVVGRLVYKTCQDHGGDALRGSPKGFRLNEPAFFGKDLKESRSRIEALPILPSMDTCMMRIQTAAIPTKGLPINVNVFIPDDKPLLIKPREEATAKEVLSVYIRQDQGMMRTGHYPGDRCKLHGPYNREKQLQEFKKMIDETNSAVEVNKSPKAFPREVVIAPPKISDIPMVLTGSESGSSTSKENNSADLADPEKGQRRASTDSKLMALFRRKDKKGSKNTIKNTYNEVGDRNRRSSDES